MTIENRTGSGWTPTTTPQPADIDTGQSSMDINQLIAQQGAIYPDGTTSADASQPKPFNWKPSAWQQNPKMQIPQMYKTWGANQQLAQNGLNLQPGKVGFGNLAPMRTGYNNLLYANGAMRSGQWYWDNELGRPALYIAPGDTGQSVMSLDELNAAFAPKSGYGGGWGGWGGWGGGGYSYQAQKNPMYFGNQGWRIRI